MRTWKAVTIALLVPLLMAQEIPYKGPPGGYTVDNPLPAMTMPFRRLHSAPTSTPRTCCSPHGAPR